MNTQEIVGKRELVDRIVRGRLEFLRAVVALPDDAWETPNVVGEWSVKDLLAHLIAHEQRALDELNTARRGEKYTFPSGDNDTFNARAVTQYKKRTSEQVRAAWLASTNRIIAAVQELSDADFEPESPVCALLEDTIDGALANNTYEHYAEHLPEVQEWLRART
jgi:uncharacterized protein (TIGR03083 family)